MNRIIHQWPQDNSAHMNSRQSNTPHYGDLISLLGCLLKYHSLGSLNRGILSHIYGGWKCEVKVLVDFLRGLSPWLADNHLHPLSSHGFPAVHAYVCAQISPSSKDISPSR